MNLQRFVEEVDKMNFGVGSFHTYKSDNNNCFFIIVTERIYQGIYYKREGSVKDLDATLFNLWTDMKNEFKAKVKYGKYE